MTADTLHGADPELDAMAEREQDAAAKIVTTTMRALRAQGWDLALVRVSKVITRGRECAAPGATAFEADDRLLPCLPREADGLRMLARAFDAAFEKRGTFEAEEGYSEDATHRVAEFAKEGS